MPIRETVVPGTGAKPEPLSRAAAGDGTTCVSKPAVLPHAGKHTSRRQSKYQARAASPGDDANPVRGKHSGGSPGEVREVSLVVSCTACTACMHSVHIVCDTSSTPRNRPPTKRSGRFAGA